MIRFAIVGTGRISSWILKGASQDPRFQAAAVCSRTESRALDFIAENKEYFKENTLIFSNINEVAESKDIDAVYIGTPNSTHLPYTLACLRGGKHVICEKPLGLNEAEVAEMVRAAGESGRALMEAMVSTVNPVFRAAAARIREIAPVRHYSSSFCQYSSRYDALKRGEVSNSFNPRMGGGALADIGIYTTYPLVRLFGYPDEVNASLLSLPSTEGDVNIQGSVLLGYAGGMTATLSFSKAVDAFSPTEICGEGGNITLDQIHIARHAAIRPHGVPGSGRGIVMEAQTIAQGLEHDEYFYEFKEFIEVIESGRTESDINSLQTSLLNARLMDAIKQK